MSEEIKRKRNEKYWENIEKIAREVDSWPSWKRNLSGLGSNYCSELQPCRHEEHDSHKDIKNKTP